MNFTTNKYKKTYSHSYAYGVFVTRELLTYHSQSVIKIILHTKGKTSGGVRKIISHCQKNNIPYEFNDGVLQKITEKENVFAMGIFKKYSPSLAQKVNHVVLVQPSDMGNTGTILRTMIGFGINQLAVIRPAIDLFDPKVVRASMGALFQISFQYFDSFEEYALLHKNHMYPFMTDGDMLLNDVKFKSPYSLIFGNESSGLPQFFRQKYSSVRIRQSKHIDSLNLSVSVGIALHHVCQGE